MGINYERVPDPYDYMKDDLRGWFERDHHLWVPLLAVAKELDYKLYDTLYGFRLLGTAIVRNQNGDFVLRPNIDPEGNVAWKSMEQYVSCRKYLQPHAKRLSILLKELRNYIERKKVRKKAV